MLDHSKLDSQKIWPPIIWFNTFFGIGKLPYAPGTFGSLGAVLLYLIIDEVSIKKFSENSIIATPICGLVITIILFILGIINTNLYSKKVNIQDPQEIVIDEVVGQLLVLCFNMTLINSFFEDQIISYSWIYWLSIITSFVGFRILDIFKPWPINWVDQHIKGGLGIMLDDIIAAIFTISIFTAIVISIFKSVEII